MPTGDKAPQCVHAHLEEALVYRTSAVDVQKRHAEGGPAVGVAEEGGEAVDECVLENAGPERGRDGVEGGEGGVGGGACGLTRGEGVVVHPHQEEVEVDGGGFRQVLLQVRGDVLVLFFCEFHSRGDVGEEGRGEEVSAAWGEEARAHEEADLVFVAVVAGGFG